MKTKSLTLYAVLSSIRVQMCQLSILTVQLGAKRSVTIKFVLSKII